MIELKFGEGGQVVVQNVRSARVSEAKSEKSGKKSWVTRRKECNAQASMVSCCTGALRCLAGPELQEVEAKVGSHVQASWAAVSGLAALGSLLNLTFPTQVGAELPGSAICK